MISIQRRLLAWLMGALVVGAALLTLTTYWLALDETNEEFDEELKQVALTVLNHADIVARPVPHRPSPADLEGYVFFTQVWTLEGERLSTSNPEVQIPFVAEEGYRTIETPGGRWRVYTDRSEKHLIQAAQLQRIRAKFAAEIAFKALLPIVLGAPLLAALLGIALRRGLAPLSRATHDIRDRSASSLASIDSKEMPDELRPLVDAINALLQRLQAALEAQKRLVADAAHELRTPLTALRLEVEALVRAPDDASRQAAAADTLMDLQRASRVVEQLLRLSRAGPETELQREPVDLGVLAQRAVVLFSPLASARGIDLGADVAPRPAGDFVIDGDPGQLGVMLENLVDNALRYTPAGGRVDVQVRIDAATNDVVLSVIDSGPGMPSEERERAFARFYRGSSARRSDVAGSGLGLAIVKATAEGHEAQVVLNEGLGLAPGAPGLSATVSFPRRTA